MYAETNPESDLVLLESIRRHLLDIPDELPPETTSFGSGDLEAYKALHDAINVGWITFDQLDACGDTSGNDVIPRVVAPVRVRNKRGSPEPSSSSSSFSTFNNDDSPASFKRRMSKTNSAACISI
ncbi:hypothetical protein JRO89_XS01G0017100 [Xanthoceras sorbifolium]|uniref:Uncharacterized protein n=1 Tax=Xanthoceras sorbifolium TaxID=99658 RepID=A0ABQ8IIF3_9ROSI|nr:hypothetical protein JRO89_XS01G0017100 [Xanthoceras sorbifolium]